MILFKRRLFNFIESALHNNILYLFMKTADVIVIGGGASGLMFGALAGKLGKEVLILEGGSKPARKILVSGGGRCNFTNLHVESSDYLSGNPHFCKSALSRFTPEHFTDLLRQYHIQFFEKTKGQLFCSQGSRQILDMLLEECEKGGVTLLTNIESIEVNRDKGDEDSIFRVETDKGDFSALKLVIATGGLSYKNLGATDFGTRLAEQFGLKVNPTSPGLVPLLHSGFESLAGIALPVEIKIHKHTINDDLLFTHRGFSGPAILQASLYYESGDILTINFLPGRDLTQDLIRVREETSAKSLQKFLGSFFPAGFVETWLSEVMGLEKKNLADLTKKDMNKLQSYFQAWRCKPNGTEGYRTAEVTKGGISVDELSSKTLEAKKVKNLHFIGEVVDVTGRLGGFNLHWAWASAAAAVSSL